jgi:hypothetical protein
MFPPISQSSRYPINESLNRRIFSLSIDKESRQLRRIQIRMSRSPFLTCVCRRRWSRSNI